MNKQMKAILLAVALPAVMLVSSCLKDTLNQSAETEQVSKVTMEARAKQKDIVAWIDRHKESAGSAQIKKLDYLKSNLSLDELTVESRDNGDNLIVIPLKDEVKAELSIVANSQLNLLIVQGKDGKYKFSHIVAYNSADGSKVSKLNALTIQNLVNNKNVSYNGSFQFYSITGGLAFQQKYKDGELVSFSRVITNASNKSNKGIIRYCIDIYDDHTIMGSDGIPYNETVYKGRECWEAENGLYPGEQGPGNNPPSNPDQPSDLAIRNTYTRYVSVEGLSNYDVSNPTTTEPEYDTDGNIIPPVPAQVPVTKVYKVEVDINKADGQIINVFLTPIYATPSLSMYTNPIYGQTTRTVDSNTSYKGFTITNNIIHCVWQGNLQFLWTFSNGQTQSTTKNADYTMDIDNP